MARRAPRGDLVLLTGGPGQPGQYFGPRMVQRLGAAAKGYRIVAIDQRGTGAGALRCPALQRAMGSSDLVVPPRAAVLACARALGDRRDAFTTADTVEDLDAIRRALGDAKWVIGGVSYGTFVAERYALAHPEATRGVLLDSVVPQEGAELLERVPLRAVGRVLPRRAVADLRRVVSTRPGLGPPLFDAITELSIGVPQLGGFPSVLRRAAAGNLRPLRRLLSAVHDGEAAPAGLLSQGLHAATLCADGPAPWPGGPAAPEAARAAATARVRQTLRASDTAPFPPSTAYRQGLFLTCRWWPPTPAPPPLPAGATVRAPGLLLNGDRDLSTPLEWARAQARTMPNAKLVVVPGAGHSIMSRAESTAWRAPLRAFLQGLR
jgi:pimeloyl-ACP methyl ester carboxylesterase